MVEAEAAEVTAFREECAELRALVETLPAETFTQRTQFKGWTVDEVLVHLHAWNRAVVLALTAPDAFDVLLADAIDVMRREGMRAWDTRHVEERGPALVQAWAHTATELCDLAAPRDPRSRIRWVGPPMTLRTAIAARQMECWAHGSEIFDLCGVERRETDRLRPIVELGWKTYGWSWKVRGEEPPAERPALELEAPSGEIWRWAGDEGAGRVAGSALDFAAVVTQTRHWHDTRLTVEGDHAAGWMARAQCFAGAPETPPAPGTRFRQT